jgi:HK97 gp10 family phage protein
MSVSIKITGLDELEKNLQQMGDEVAAKNMVSAVHNAAGIVEKEAKANLMVAGAIRTGTLFRAIRRKKVIYPQTGTIVIVVGVSKGVSGYDSKGNKVIPWRYAHFVEKSSNFLENAKNSTAEEVKKRIVASLQRKLKKFLKT